MSMWWSAAVVEGDVDSTVRDVAVLGTIGGGRCVERNIWYVCTLARMKRQERGITGRPRRRVRFWSAKALE